LRFTLTQEVAKSLFTYPAEHTTTSTNGTVPYGARFRLIDDHGGPIDQMINGWKTTNPESYVIAIALQQYGMILADIGMDMYLQGAATSMDTNNVPLIDPTTGKAMTWNMTDLSSGLGTIPTTDFQMVSMTPVVTSISPLTAAAGTTITINGVNFSGSANNLTVLFGSGTTFTASPQVTYVSDTQITAVVPAGSGTVDVRVISRQAVPIREMVALSSATAFPRLAVTTASPSGRGAPRSRPSRPARPSSRAKLIP
jgi:hypothetical protein